MKLPLFLFLFLFSLTFLSASSFGYDSTQQNSLGTFKSGEDINLIQTCSNCSQNNITNVIYPNGSIAISNVEMDKDGSYYNYTLNSQYTLPLGIYKVNGIGDPSSVNTVWSYSFEVTSTGKNFNSISKNPVLIILLFLAISFLGLGASLKNSNLGFIGSIFLLLSGIYLTIYGLNNVADFYTQGGGIALISLGFIFMFVSAYEWWKFSEDEGDEE